MLSRVNGPKSLLAGLIYITAGITFFFWAQTYPLGSATHMGPGYFPALLGVVLFLFGAGAIIQGLRTKTPDPITKIRVEPLLLILASVVSFGFLIERAGMVVATFVCIFFACFRRLLTNPIEVFLIFAVLTAFNYTVFIYIFGMDIPVFWWSR